MKAQHTALIPTLTLWEVELEKQHASAEDERQFVQSGVNELKTYFDQGGTILFGTDVGYHPALRHDGRVCPDGEERHDLARHSGLADYESGDVLQGRAHSGELARAMMPIWWCSMPIRPPTFATSRTSITPSAAERLFIRSKHIPAKSRYFPIRNSPLPGHIPDLARRESFPANARSSLVERKIWFQPLAKRPACARESRAIIDVPLCRRVRDRTHSGSNGTSPWSKSSAHGRHRRRSAGPRLRSGNSCRNRRWLAGKTPAGLGSLRWRLRPGGRQGFPW